MNEIIWKIVFMILWLGSGLVRMPHGRNYKKTEKIKSKKKRLPAADIEADLIKLFPFSDGMPLVAKECV